MSTNFLTKFIKNITIYIIVVLCNFSIASAQNSKLIFEKISQKNGLSNNAIKSIFQDKRGFMWFGSINGLNRYDGKDMVVFNHNIKNKKSISNDFINCIKEDKDQNLWIGTYKGINKYNPRTGEFYNNNNNPKKLKLFDTDFISTIQICKNGLIWIGTKNKGLLVYDIKKNNLRAFALDKNQIGKVINFIKEDANENIWVGTTTGVYRILLKNQSILNTEKLLDVSINLIYNDSKNNLWFGTTLGLYKLSNNDLLKSQSTNFTSYFKSNTKGQISHNDVTAIYEDKDGELWVGTDGGGLNRSKNTNTLIFSHYQNIPDNTNSLTQNQIFAITQDFSGVLWIGTNDGINKVKKSVYPFIHFQSNPLKANSLESNNVAALKMITLHNKEYILCGATGGTGLGIIATSDVHSNNEQFIHIKDFDPLLNNRKYQSFLEYSDDSLLVGTKSGIRLFNLKSNKFVPIKNSLNQLPKYVVRKIYKDKKGLVWIGTSDGLFTWNAVQNSLTKIPLNDQIINDNDYKNFVERSSLNNIFAIVEDDKNNIWVGTWGGGLLKFNDGMPQKQPIRYTRGENENALSNNYVVSLLYIDAKLWIGSSAGLSYLALPEIGDRSAKFINVDLSKNSKKIQVAGILSDHHKNLWLATINGILKYNTTNRTTTAYEVSNGDLTKENYQMGLTQDAEGYLYFGGINGIISFHPDSIKIDQKKYPIVLTDFKIFKKNQTEPDYNRTTYFNNNEVSLTPKEYAFTFSFSKLNYKISDEINYAYMLDGIDKTWINSKSDQRSATYSNLSPGTYILKVKATNEYNIWSEPVKLLTIIILTPWWLSWWAYIIYLLILFGFVYVIVKYVLEKERLKNNLAIERIEKQKVKEVDELKFKYFTNISHEFRTPLTLILGPLEQLYESFPTFNSSVKNNLKHIQHNVSHLLRLINQLMDFRKIEEGNLKLSITQNNFLVFVKAVIDNFELLAKKKNISLQLSSKLSDEENGWFDYDKLEKILNNLIHNALSFTPSDGKIILEVSLFNKEEIKFLKIAVIDSGKGIKTEELNLIFEHFYQANNQTRSFTKGYGIGLSLTKDLLKIHKGSISVMSDGQNGTTFIVELPINKYSYTSEELNTESVVNLLQPFDFQNVEIDDNVVVENETFTNSKTVKKPALLIVEDNIEIRKYIVNCFASDYKLIEAENGEEGREKANKFAPDLIISDVMMPIMDGIKFCETIKTEIATSHIPVILLTALNSKEHLIEGLETGADIYITKPFHNDVLKLNVRNLLQSRKKLREKFAQTISLEPSDVTVNSVDELFLTKAMGIVEKNIKDSNYNIDDFVDQMNMGRSAFYRKLKQLSDQSPNEFIRTVRLKRAAQLLKQQAGTISEISYETGFIDPAYFTRCFKKQFGVTPSEFNSNFKGIE